MSNVSTLPAPPDDEGQFPKACGCGLIYSREAWGKLEYLGPQDDGEALLELRNCTCGSTLAVIVGPSPCITSSR